MAISEDLNKFFRTKQRMYLYESLKFIYKMDLIWFMGMTHEAWLTNKWDKKTQTNDNGLLNGKKCTRTNTPHINKIND